MQLTDLLAKFVQTFFINIPFKKKWRKKNINKKFYKNFNPLFSMLKELDFILYKNYAKTKNFQTNF